MAESSISELRKQERIIVVPEHVEAPMWHNAPATLIRDVNEQGIYQNFSRQNSTYYDGSEPRTESADLESQNSNSEALDTDTDVTQKAPSESAQTTSPVVETNLEGAAEDGGKSQDTVVEPAQEENVSESAQNIVSYVQTIQKSFSYFFTHTTFAQEAVNTPDDVSVPILVGNEAENVAREDTSIQDIPHTDFHDEISEELQAERVDDVIQSETVPGEVRDTFSDENHATTSSTTNDEHEPVYTPIVGDSLTLSGFDMPRLESGQFIRNMQLRVSVGALTHIDTDDSMPSLEVEFTLGEGVWKSAGTILLEDEISNALNGGYYLFALPKIRDSKDLENFEVRFTYVGAVEAIKNLYVDSAWLEIDTEIFDREVLKNRISADNLSHLKKSDIFTLLSTDTDFTKGEVPHFTMRYESQRNPAIRFMRELLGRKLIDVRSLGVTHANVGVMSITPDVQVAQDGLITVQFSDADREKMQPGEYEIEITVTEGGKLFTDTFNFQWGMLALNPDKAEYAVGETAHLSFGALTRNGNTLCDANLQLYIIDPEEYISEVSVTQSGKCLGNNVTEVPDYQASFSPTHAGTYTMYLERVDAEGNVLAHTSDTFLVAETHDVSITRVGPTRIFPPAPYPMTLTVAASSSFRGTVTERVPYTFEIFDTDASVREVGAYKELTWDIDIRAEETKSFSYSFDAPDLSPYLYTLGPAKIESVGKNAHLTLTEPASSSTPNSTNASTSDIAIPETSSQSSVIYEEHRAWQIASDATGNMLLFWDGTGGLPSGWTCVSCVSGDPFFQKFIMGSSTYNAATGTASHTPTASGSYLASSGSAVENFSGSTISVTAHTHSFTPTVASASNLPSYRQLKVIQYTASAGEPASIPTGAIGMFDGALPSGWTAYTAQNGYYIRGENTPGTTGGSNTHTHSVTGTSGTAGGSTVGNRGGGTQANGAPAGHTHTISTTTLSVSNEPPYREVVLAKLNATSSPQNDLITMWTDSVPTSWIDVSTNGSSAFSRKILKVASGYGATGGSVTHNHANISNIISSGSSGTLVSGRTGSAGSSFTHTHSVSVSNFSVSNNLPPTITVIIGKRQGDNPLFAQQSYRWYANTNAQTPTDPWPAGATNIVEAEPITATSTPLKFGDIARLRMNVSVANATATIASTSVKLQYASTTGTCASASVWNYVGSATSSAIWKGYNNSLVSDHGTLSTTTLATSTVLESYEENGYSALIPNQIRVGKVGEWDFVLQQNGAYPGATYCFRLVTANGSPFNSYITYPTLLTNRAPVSPTVSKLFDNEKIASTTPWFEFVSTDPESQDITYQIQIDNDYDFSSTVSDHNSASNGTLFENLITPSDKDPFTSGQLIRYKSNTTLTNGVTYWIRVRGKDPSGSNVWGDWSAARSFTIDTSLTVSAWHQTTREQFSTDTLSGVTAVISNQVQLISGSTTGSMVTSAIRFNDGSKGNAWDSLSWSDTETVGDIKYHIEYYNGSAWQQISDSVLSGNVTGFDTSPVSLLGLDTGTYGTIRIVADFTDSGGSPSLQDVTVSWGYRVSTPETPKPFANEKVGTTTPSFQFSASDPQGDSLTYQISWSTSNLFTSSTTRTSDAHAGFVNINQGGDLDPFNTGNSIRFTVQSSDTLTNNTTYWWRVRAKDPAGSNAWSLWSSAQSFTVDTTVIVSTWFQTTQQQFATNILSGTKALSSNVLAVATTASEAMVVYGEGVQTEPKYRTWDGSAWSSQGSL
ncbi:MAG TPA: hypothetical protein VFV22_00540, partial [Candidatus Paceibacterota bacterium]|nr:hypothetical protein [Candidatus Paceibacterota bacterium]